MGAALTRSDLNGSSRRDSYSGSSLLWIYMNINKKVLALKYRPQKFDDLIGQDVVTETIKNSIKSKVKHDKDITLKGLIKISELIK